LLSVLLVLSGCAYDVDPAGSTEEALVVTDRCRMRGMAILENGDFVAGRAQGGDTSVDGRWLHVAESGEVMVATPDRITCRVNGSLIGEIFGTAELDGTPGYTFRVFVQDRREPGPPEVIEGAPQTRTLTATRTYRPSRWEVGSLGERALVTIPEELPVTEGNAGNGWAWLTFQRHGSYDVVTCRYRGGASTRFPRTPAELAAGERYHLERCTGEWRGTDPVEAGSRVDARWMRLRVQSGAHFLPSRRDARTTVSVDLEITPLIEIESPPDFYRMEVRDAAGDRVLLRTGNVAAGDLDVVELD
jgi:hypothetical protein